jgi:hypothetical protein
VPAWGFRIKHLAGVTVRIRSGAYEVLFRSGQLMLDKPTPPMEIQSGTRRPKTSTGRTWPLFFTPTRLSHREIADVRSTSEATVRQQALVIYRKSGLRNRSELSAFFLEDLLLPRTPA